MSAHELAAWAALGVSLILLATLVATVVLALRFWRRVAPTVTPMLSMFTPARVGVTSGEAIGSGRTPSASEREPGSPSEADPEAPL